MFNIRLEGKAPIYEQLYGVIARLIASGEMSAEERLPAVREVAKHLGINPNTVQKAYSLLEQSGLIYSIPAKGSYVAGGRAADAILAEAKKRLSAELSAAHSSGISLPEVVSLAEGIWNNEKGEKV